MSSSSSTDVAGFDILAELGRGTETVVYEAVQVGLGRHVALKLLPADTPAQLDWPDHPCVVSLYAFGPWEEGRFVAMQLVNGSTLARLLESGELTPERSLDLLSDVASALDAAHHAGIAHGAVTPSNVLVDRQGRTLLSDFGLGRRTPTVAGDRADFARLVEKCLGDLVALPADPPAPGELARQARAAVAASPPPARGRRAAIGVALLAAVAVVAGFALGSAGDDAGPQRARGAVALGSDLPGAGVESLDCSGRSPSGASNNCTVVQTRLPGRRLRPDAPGAIRGWAVRGASGHVALQVLRRRGHRYASVARSRFAHITDSDVHFMPADLPVRRGDLIGVQLAPGAAIGVRRVVRGATTARWLGQLFVEPRPLELGAGSGFDHELLLRADYVRGERATSAGEITGRAARRAPAGRTLASVTVEVRRRVRTVAVVRSSDGIALDLLAGSRRLARVPVADAARGGRLLRLSAFGTVKPIVSWRNPDGSAISRVYSVGRRTLIPRG